MIIDFDVETTGLQPYSGNNEAFLWIFSDGETHEAIPFSPSGAAIESWGYQADDPRYAENQVRIQAWFDRVRLNPEAKLRAWNARFDRAFADQAGCFKTPGDGQWFDAMLVAHAIDERRSVALKAVAAQLFGDDAADPQKKLKEWLNAENRRRATLLKDADKAEQGKLRVKYVQAKCSDRKCKFLRELPEGESVEACPDCGADVKLMNKTRPATDAEGAAVIAEAARITNAKGEYVRANYSNVPQEIMEPYALEDVILTRKISEVYDPVIEASDLKRVVEFEHKSLDALYAIERRGLPVKEHGVEYRRLEQEVIDNLEQLEERVHELVNKADPVVYARELAGDSWGEGKTFAYKDESGTLHLTGGAAALRDFNPKSTPQILAALKARGADMRFMTPHQQTGNIGADADNLRAVDDDLSQAILDFRSEFKVLSTYTRPMIDRSFNKAMNVYKEPFIAPDSRIHATYRQVGARTGRMSCIAAGSYVDAPRDLLRYPKGIKIENIEVGQYVYSFDENNDPRPRRVTQVMDQGKQPVLRLVWRAAGNKSYLGELKATPDHRIRLRDGSYRRMDELQPGDQLAYLSRQVTSDGYARLGWKLGGGNGVASSVDEHRWLVNDGEVTHHINGQKLDNSMDNLISMSVSAHSTLHNPVGTQRPERYKECPFTRDELQEILGHGIKRAINSFPHDYATFKRWAAEYGISVPDKRLALPTNHVVVAVIDDGETLSTYDLSIEDTPNFIVNEIGVHNCADPNMQNQPRDDLRLRYNIVAAPGHKLITCDLSNIEMVLFAAYCGEGRLLSAIREGEDLHTLTAEMIGLRDRKRSGGGIETARQLGKVFNFTIIYGGGLRSIKKYFRCTREEAQRYKNRYMDAYPEVRRLQNRIDFRLADDGYIQDKLISGRRYRVAQRDSYKAVNYLVQGTASSVLKQAVNNLHLDGVPMVALIHDEVVAHVPEDEALDVAKLIEKRMTECPQLDGVVPLRAEYDIVDRWSDAKPLKDADADGVAYYFDPEWAAVPRRYVNENYTSPIRNTSEALATEIGDARD